MRNQLGSALTSLFSLAASFGWADSYWGSAGGNYTNAASWQAGGVPQLADSAFFANDVAYTVGFTANWTNKTASFEGPTQAVTLDIGAGNTWGLTNEFRIGYGNKTGRVMIGSGTLRVAVNLDLGRGTGTTRNTGSANNLLVVTNGAKVVTGALGLGVYGLESSDAGNLLHVTGAGNAVSVEGGTLNIGGLFTERGNTVKVSDGGYLAVRNYNVSVGSGYPGNTNNTLIVEGAGSQFEVVALTGNKTFYVRQDNRIEIRDGGNLTLRYEGATARNVYFAPKERFQLLIGSGGSFTNVANSQSTPTFNNASRCEISGGGTFYSNPNIYFTDDSQLLVTGHSSKVAGNNVYFQGNTYFEVSGGASNLLSRTYVGSSVGADARMLLTGAGSYAYSEFNIQDGRGRITIADGAFFDAGRLQTAINAGSTGIVEVTGSGSLLSSRHASINHIGMSGLCTLTVTNGGTLTAPSLNIGLNASAAGSELRLYDGTVICAGTVSNLYGKISICGTGGAFAPEKLVAASSSELAFIAGPTGFTQFRPGTLTVNSGAKLTIDARAWRPVQTVVTNLTAYASMPTPFDSENIAVTVADNYSWSLNQGTGVNSAIALTLIPPLKGTVILVN